MSIQNDIVSQVLSGQLRTIFRERNYSQLVVVASINRQEAVLLHGAFEYTRHGEVIFSGRCPVDKFFGDHKAALKAARLLIKGGE